MSVIILLTVIMKERCDRKYALDIDAIYNLKLRKTT
jgi:hypothetical protein